MLGREDSVRLHITLTYLSWSSGYLGNTSLRFRKSTCSKNIYIWNLEERYTTVRSYKIITKQHFFQCCRRESIQRRHLRWASQFSCSQRGEVKNRKSSFIESPLLRGLSLQLLIMACPIHSGTHNLEISSFFQLKK